MTEDILFEGFFEYNWHVGDMAIITLGPHKGKAAKVVEVPYSDPMGSALELEFLEPGPQQIPSVVVFSDDMANTNFRPATDAEKEMLQVLYG